MARQLHHRKKDNKYALWSTIVDDYVTEWEDKEEIRKQWYLDKFESAMKDVELYLGEDGYQYSDNAIVKHSPNLIDLIQCGDYVNGEKVTEIKEWNSSKDGYYRYAVTCHYEIIRADEIKTIVTKEMMESISYKVTKM